MKTKQQFLGLLRETLTAGGALIFGAYDGQTAIVGLIIAIAAIVWAIVHHEGRGVLKTSVRKALSALPGVLLAFGLINDTQAVQAAALIAPAFALAWSLYDNGGTPPGGAGVVALWWFVLGLAACLLPSCGAVSGYQVDGRGLDWETDPIQTLPPEKVTPLIDVPMPKQMGGGTMTIPLILSEK